MLGVGFNIGRTRKRIRKRGGGSGGTRSYTSDFSSGVDSWSSNYTGSIPNAPDPFYSLSGSGSVDGSSGWLKAETNAAANSNYNKGKDAYIQRVLFTDVSNGDAVSSASFKIYLNGTSAQWNDSNRVDIEVTVLGGGTQSFSIDTNTTETVTLNATTVGSTDTTLMKIRFPGGSSEGRPESGSEIFIKDISVEAVAAANSANKSARVSRTNQLLDNYTSPSFAFSLRRLDADLEVTNCIRVRRENDNVEADISYIGFNLDTGAIASHCGTSNGFVSKWYDQSGNGNDAVQTVHGSQPKIYDRGSGVVTENGKPALDFSNDTLNLTNSVTSNAMTVFDVRHDASDYFLRDDGTQHADGDHIYSHLFGQIRTRLGGVFAIDMTSGAAASGVQRLLTFTKPGTSGVPARHYKNGVDLFDSGYSSVDDESGTFTRLGHSYVGKSQELIFYNRDESLNKEVIWSNINKHYEIGNFGEPDSGILAEFEGAAAAYSVRQLSDTAFKCMRVRRDTSGGAGDDDEQDFGFDANGDLDTAGIATFVGSGNNGYVSKWYDQSGNGNEATFSVSTSQPSIYDGSAVPTANSIPALNFDAANGNASTSAFNLNDFGLYVVNQASTTPNSYQAPVTLGGVVNKQAVLNYRTSQQVYFGLTSGTNSTNTTYNLSSMYADNASSEVKGYFNNTEITSTTPSSESVSVIQVGHIRFISSTLFKGTMQELIAFGSSTKSDHNGIQGNINAHFKIGNFGTPTSGLLSTYTGAEAAYSVRQLANTAALSMRVRRDNDDAEQDFGFDANGNLDTAAIATFVGSGNNGYVSKWYDQSGNQNDAAQTTNGIQPQIASSGAVITNSGKPALQGGRYEAVSGITLSSDFSSFEVYNSNGDTVFCTYGGGPNNTYAPIAIPNLSNGGYRNFGSPSFYKNGSSISISSMNDAYTELAINSTLLLSIVDASTANWVNLYMNSFNNGSFSFDGYMHEQIFFSVDNTSNRSGIETDINNYFSIY